MQKIDKTVTTPASPAKVFHYLADFTTSGEWDPGTVRTTLISGDGGVGTRYKNISEFRGNETELVYTVLTYEPDTLFVIRGENKTVTATDTMTFTPTPDGGTEVRYEAVFEFKRWIRFVSFLLTPSFKKLGEQAERQLKESLTTLGS